MTERCCRHCGIDDIPGLVEIDGTVLCWVDDDLCSFCEEWLAEQLQRDAERYRFLRNRPMRVADCSLGGVFAGRIPENTVLGGEHLDRAVDAEMGIVTQGAPLEDRLAECLAAAIDTPLLTVRDTTGGATIELTLGAFSAELSERAAELLEEAGE